jgi:hypothetical protein
MLPIPCPSLDHPAADWHQGFLEMLPRIERHARIALRGLSGEAKDDAVCEVVANCLCSYRRLHERNQLQRAFATTLARFAVAHVYRGRHVGTSSCAHDVYSTPARQRFRLELPSHGAENDRSEWLECLADNRRTPVPEQAHFRIEFPRWLRRQTKRNQQIARRLLLGYSTEDVALQFRLSPGRVSQLRREFYESWSEFTGDRSLAAVQKALRKRS